jgi:hypothetical protein
MQENSFPEKKMVQRIFYCPLGCDTVQSNPMQVQREVVKCFN